MIHYFITMKLFNEAALNYADTSYLVNLYEDSRRHASALFAGRSLLSISQRHAIRYSE